MSKELTNNLWIDFFSVSGFEQLYNRQYSYDEMKIMSVLSHKEYTTADISYEELCLLTVLTKYLWDAAFALKHKFSRSSMIEEKAKIAYDIVASDPFYAQLSYSKEGYSQYYAGAIAANLVQKYLEFQTI